MSRYLKLAAEHTTPCECDALLPGPHTGGEEGRFAKVSRHLGGPPLCEQVAVACRRMGLPVEELAEQLGTSTWKLPACCWAAFEGRDQ